ncbi:MAG TPA: DUF4351 domain-containing protein [Verrucomicrobiae bacterium]|jgi:predicted transposase YdaD
MIDHDRLFKELLTAFFADFVELFLPNLSGCVDKDSFVFLDKEIFTDVTRGERHEADLVVKAQFLGRDSFFLIHLEHQAQAQRDFGQRMFAYFARLRERHALPIYPIVLFSHASRVPEPDYYELGFPDLMVMQFRYRVIQLGLMKWRDYMRRANPVASALMAKMGMTAEERPRVKLECLRLLAILKLDVAKMRLISGFVDSYLRLTAQEVLIFRREADTLEPKEKVTMMELTTSWKEEGIAEGLERGRHEGLERGRQEASQQVVARLVRHRWGELPANMVAQLKVLSFDDSQNLAEALWDFTSLADVEKWLADNPAPPKA